MKPGKLSYALIIFLTLCTIGLHGKTICAMQTEGDKTVESDGSGSSKNAALLDAKRNAVEKGIGTFLISETEVKNFMLQKDVVLTQTMGAVKRYKTLEERKEADGTFYVRIQAVVSLSGIKADLAALKILLESMDKPRMMVLIREEGGNVAESAVLDYLTGKNFDLVDAATVAALMEKEDSLIRKATQGDPVAAAKIGAANGAEYVIVGNATKSLGHSDLLASTGMKSGQAAITAKVINCSNARIIASKTANSAVAHISEDVAQAKATEKAAKKLMDRKLFEQIVSSFQDMVNNGMTFDVVVKNVPDFKTQKAVQKTIGLLSGVVSVNKRGFGGGEVKLNVQFKGNPDTFAEAIDQKAVAGKKFSVTDIVGSSVIIQLQ